MPPHLQQAKKGKGGCCRGLGVLLLSGSDSFQRSTLQSKVGVGVRALVAISGVWSHTFFVALRGRLRF